MNLICEFILLMIVFCESCTLSYFRLFLDCQISYIIICVSVSINFLHLELMLFELSVKMCSCGVSCCLVSFW